MPAENAPSTRLFHEIRRQHSTVEQGEGTSWQANFGHLVSYGACYYSYTYARAMAAAVWRDGFALDPLAPEGGDALWRLVLSQGNARPAEQMLLDLQARGGETEGEGQLWVDGAPNPAALIKELGL